MSNEDAAVASSIDEVVDTPTGTLSLVNVHVMEWVGMAQDGQPIYSEARTVPLDLEKAREGFVTVGAGDSYDIDLRPLQPWQKQELIPGMVLDDAHPYGSFKIGQNGHMSKEMRAYTREQGELVSVGQEAYQSQGEEHYVEREEVLTFIPKRSGRGANTALVREGQLTPNSKIKTDLQDGDRIFIGVTQGGFPSYILELEEAQLEQQKYMQ